MDAMTPPCTRFNALRRVGRCVGYRGAGLLLCGLAWINWGFGLILDPGYGAVRGAAALTSLAPMTVWGWAWIGTGALACCAAVLPSSRDWWGWAAATVMPVMWAVAYTCARAVGEFPQGVSSGLTWLVSPGLATLLAMCTRQLVELRREIARLRKVAGPVGACEGGGM